jgi:hypothetical protein
MASHDAAAFGVFPTIANAEAAVDGLTMAGFSNQDVSVLLSDQAELEAFAEENNTNASGGATARAGVGGVVGGTLGLLAGLGALAIPGVGPLIAAGPIMASLAGLGVGGLVGALVGMGIPEFEARVYDGRLKDGGVLLAVHCESFEGILKAREVLKAVGAEDVASSEESISSSGEDYGRAP